MATFNDAVQLKSIRWIKCLAELRNSPILDHTHLLSNSHIQLPLESFNWCHSVLSRETAEPSMTSDRYGVSRTERQFMSSIIDTVSDVWYNSTEMMSWGVSALVCLTEPQSRGAGSWVGHIYCNVCCFNSILYCIYTRQGESLEESLVSYAHQGCIF